MTPPSDVFHAVSDANRRHLLDLLADGEERPVQDLVPYFSITFQAVSQHLQVLAHAGLVTKRKEGRYRLYRIQPDGLRAVFDWAARYRGFWEGRLENLERYLDET
ncbi:MAG: metalloregulator ArsR/SmtB family transcription factor [Pseudomonadota bacterium]